MYVYFELGQFDNGIFNGDLIDIFYGENKKKTRHTHPFSSRSFSGEKMLINLHHFCFVSFYFLIVHRRLLIWIVDTSNSKTSWQARWPQLFTFDEKRREAEIDNDDGERTEEENERKSR